MNEYTILQIFLSSPMFGTLLTIPISIVKKYVRNKNESSSLFEISFIGSKLDILFRQYGVVLRRLQELDGCFENVKHNINEADNNLTSPGIPVLEQYYEIMLRNENLIRSKLESLVVELNEEKQKLNQFMMMNRSIAEELTNANCIGLANDKNLIADLETQLISRMESVTLQIPCNDCNTHWDSFLKNRSSLKEEIT